MSRRRLRRKSARAKPRVDPLRALIDELARGTQHEPEIPRHNVAAPAVRRTQRVERLAYTRTQAAAALARNGFLAVERDADGWTVRLGPRLTA